MCRFEEGKRYKRGRDGQIVEEMRYTRFPGPSPINTEILESGGVFIVDGVFDCVQGLLTDWHPSFHLVLTFPGPIIQRQTCASTTPLERRPGPLR